MLSASDDLGFHGFYRHLTRLFMLGLVGLDWDLREYHDMPSLEAGAGAEGKHAWLTTILLLTFIVVTSVLLMNLLIAMMGNTYNNVERCCERRWHVERANLMHTLEEEYAMDLRRKRVRYGFAEDGDPNVEKKDMHLEVLITDKEWRQKSLKVLRASTQFCDTHGRACFVFLPKNVDLQPPLLALQVPSDCVPKLLSWRLDGPSLFEISISKRHAAVCSGGP